MITREIDHDGHVSRWVSEADTLTTDTCGDVFEGTYQRCWNRPFWKWRIEHVQPDGWVDAGLLAEDDLPPLSPEEALMWAFVMRELFSQLGVEVDGPVGPSESRRN